MQSTVIKWQGLKEGRKAHLKRFSDVEPTARKAHGPLAVLGNKAAGKRQQMFSVLEEELRNEALRVFPSLLRHPNRMLH